MEYISITKNLNAKIKKEKEDKKMKAIFFIAMGAWLLSVGAGIIQMLREGVPSEKGHVNWGAIIALIGAVPVVTLGWLAGF
jgi:hypothetical protein